MSRYWALRRQSEDGFTLIESLVACVVLMILSAAVFGILATAMRTTKSNTHRVGASQLAARELSIWRQKYNYGTSADKDTVEGGGSTHWIPVHDKAGDALASGSVVTVDGVGYTVKTQVAPQLVGLGKSPCDGGSLVAHPEYLLTTTVTWPNMGVTAPITSSTLLTPPKTTGADTTYGYLAVSVADAAGDGVVGIDVAVSGPDGTLDPATTDAAGCAVVRTTVAGSYTATLDATGYVDASGQNVSTATKPIVLGQLSTLPMYYDQAATLNVSFTGPAGYALPTTLPQITMANTGIQPAGTLVVPATGPTTDITSLWPYSSGYSLWAGSCADGDPAAAPTLGSRSDATVVAPGASVDATVALQPIDVVLTDSDGDAIANATVTATKVSPAPAACASAADGTLTLGVTDVNGHLGVLLPNGYWQVSSLTATANLTVAGTGASISLATS